MPRGVLYTYLKCRIVIGVPVHFGQYSVLRSYYTYQRGFWRCSFLTFGLTRASNREASIVQGFTLFLCLHLNILTAVL